MSAIQLGGGAPPKLPPQTLGGSCPPCTPGLGIAGGWGGSPLHPNEGDNEGVPPPEVGGGCSPPSMWGCRRDPPNKGAEMEPWGAGCLPGPGAPPILGGGGSDTPSPQHSVWGLTPMGRGWGVPGAAGGRKGGTHCLGGVPLYWGGGPGGTLGVWGGCWGGQGMLAGGHWGDTHGSPRRSWPRPTVLGAADVAGGAQGSPKSAPPPPPGHTVTAVPPGDAECPPARQRAPALPLAPPTLSAAILGAAPPLPFPHPFLMAPPALPLPLPAGAPPTSGVAGSVAGCHGDRRRRLRPGQRQRRSGQGRGPGTSRYGPGTGGGTSAGGGLRAGPGTGGAPWGPLATALPRGVGAGGGPGGGGWVRTGPGLGTWGCTLRGGSGGRRSLGDVGVPSGEVWRQPPALGTLGFL